MEDRQNPPYQIQRYRPLILMIGLALSLGIVLAAFEHKSYIKAPIVFTTQSTDHYTPIIPRTVIEPPKPHQSQVPLLVPIEDDVDIDEPIIDFEWEYDENQAIEDVYFEPDDPEKPAETELILILEKEASFPGGPNAWMSYLRKNIKYPKHASRAGIEGRVFLQFTVDTNGTLSDIQVIRGIGGGCDEEAIRVLKNSPNWNPGKQRGRPVKSRRTIAIVFKLR